MKNKKVILVIGIISVLLFLTIIGFYSNVDLGLFKEKNIYIFSDIAECEKIAAFEGVSFSKYDSPDKDSYLKGLAYASFAGGNYAFRGDEFELFAYEFDDASSSQEYFRNVTGKAIEKNPNYSILRGSSRYRMVVIDGKKAYYLSCSAKAGDGIVELLSEIFTCKLENRQDDGSFVS